MPPADPLRARLDALFDQALELADEDRAALLERVAADTPSLAADLEELLRLAARPAPGLAPDALAGSPLWRDLAGSPPGATASADARIGAWRLVSELGSGGMGTVWLAERADGQYEQKAALKLLHPGPRAAALVDRFERERQILARLDHPHIARLLDGGVAEDGRPWFAMEYVDGEPIDAFCDRRRLPVEARLRLFIQVARAVQAAHGGLVVHRDLKPSNILVTREGFPRLLDFGIAKPLDAQPDAEAATRTLLVLTPEYASPEQVRGEPTMVASDVYQLGLLLYELLTGERAQRLERPGPAELERVVCQRTPPLPSAAVTAGGHSSRAPRRAVPADRALAEARRTTPAALRRRLRGDLDAIVMKALRKEPERRYGSVAELADDVDGYLQGLPVRARPETLRYRMTKLVRRHPLGVAAGAALALLIVAYAITATWQARQLARERDQVRVEAARTERARDYLLGLLTAAHPFRSRREASTAGEMAAVAAEQIRGDLRIEPETRAELLGALGEVLQAFAELDRAEDLLAESLAIQRRLHPRDHPDLARAILRYARLLNARGEWEAGRRVAQEALEMYRRLYGPKHETVAESRTTVAFSLLFLTRYREAEVAFRETVELLRRLDLLDDGEGPTSRLWNGLGITLTRLGRFEEAEAVLGRALALRVRRSGPDSLGASTVYANLARSLMHQGRFEEAERLSVRVLEIGRRVFPDDHPRVATALHRIGELRRHIGRLDEAEDHHLQALEIRRRLLPEGHHRIAESLAALARVARDKGAIEEAERLHGEALSMLRASVPREHWLLGRSHLDLGWLLLRQGRTAEAAPRLWHALLIYRATSGEDSPGTAAAGIALGLLRAEQGRGTVARALIEPGLKRLRGYALADTELVEEATRTLADLS